MPLRRARPALSLLRLPPRGPLPELWLFVSGPPSEWPDSRAPSDAAQPDPAASQDPKAIVAVAYDSYAQPIYSFSLHHTRDAELAADITQETFVRMLKQVYDHGSPDNVKGWLYRVATNLAVSHARRRSVARRFTERFAGPDETAPSTEAVVVERAENQQLHEALAVLGGDARAGLLLAAHGFSGRQIADLIGRSEVATRSLLRRARIQLREQLGRGSGGS